MLCTKCGTSNTNTAIVCRSCSALLPIGEEKPSTAKKPAVQPFSGGPWDLSRLPIDQQPTAFRTSALPGVQPLLDPPWFMPGAQNSPEKEPPLRPADVWPAIAQPTGKLQASQPTTRPTKPVAPSPVSGPYPQRRIADYPTNVHNIPAPTMPAKAPADHLQGNFAPPPGMPGPRMRLSGEQNVPENRPPASQPLAVNQPIPRSMALQVVPTPGVPAILTAEAEATKLIKPLPVWAFLLSILIGILLLAGLTFLSPDWATGAVLAGVTAVIVIILLAIVSGVRVALGLLSPANPHRRAQLICVSVPLLLLLIWSIIGFTQQTSWHAAQARFLEGRQNWQTALTEYQAAGEVAPTSAELARVYNEWGEDLSGHQQYASAVEKFTIVLNTYTQAPVQFSLASTNLLAAYQSWGNYAMNQQDYTGATAHYDTLLGLTYCDDSCQLRTQSSDATAYYQLAEHQLEVDNFSASATAFGMLSARFPSSPEAQMIHTDYARALWGSGQQQLNTACSNAVKTYQQLTQEFADTTQGKQAAIALQQPVTVTGHFSTKIPGAPDTPTVALVQGLFIGIQQYQFPPLLAQAPSSTIKSDGTFTLLKVPQGSYELVWSSDGKLHFFYASDGKHVLYNAKIGPLCTYNYGDINETIPVTN